MDPLSLCTVIAWVALHVGAILIAWGTRVAIGSRAEVMLQLAFFAIMGAVGLAAAVCHALELGLWAPSVGTLILMVLTAVVDFRRTHEPAQIAHHATRR
jgi:hypothetical protein